MAGAGVTRISEVPLDLGRHSDRERYDALAGSEPKRPAHCGQFLDYPRGAVPLLAIRLGLR